MKKSIKISGAIFVVLIFTMSLFICSISLLSYFNIITNFQVCNVIFKIILFSIEIDLIILGICVLLYVSYSIYKEHKSKRNKLTK